MYFFSTAAVLGLHQQAGDRDPARGHQPRHPPESPQLHLHGRGPDSRGGPSPAHSGGREPRNQGVDG